MNYRIYARPQSIKQARRPEFYKYTRQPVTRWVKFSLNFELLVNRVMKFLLGQRLFNNSIFCTTNCIILYPRNNHATEKKIKKLKINSMVSKLLTFITGRMKPWIIESTHGLNQSSNQARRPEFNRYTRLPGRDWLGQIRYNFRIAKFFKSIVLKVT